MCQRFSSCTVYRPLAAEAASGFLGPELARLGGTCISAADSPDIDVLVYSAYNCSTRAPFFLYCFYLTTLILVGAVEFTIFLISIFSVEN